MTRRTANRLLRIAGEYGFIEVPSRSRAARLFCVFVCGGIPEKWCESSRTVEIRSVLEKLRVVKLAERLYTEDTLRTLEYLWAWGRFLFGTANPLFRSATRRLISSFRAHVVWVTGGAVGMDVYASLLRGKLADFDAAIALAGDAECEGCALQAIAMASVMTGSPRPVSQWQLCCEERGFADRAFLEQLV